VPGHAFEVEHIAHDILVVAIVVLTAAIFAAMAWASRPH
jgi:hypothetical protein